MKIYYIFILLLIASCSEKKEATLVPVREITFDVGYAPDHRMTAVYYDAKTGIDYIYFQSMNVDKMSFFTLDGKLQQETSLQSVKIEKNEVKGIIVASLDTIIVCVNYPVNKLYFLNAQGDCWRTILLDSIVPGRNLEYNISENSKCINNSILFYTFWIGSNDQYSIMNRNEQWCYYINNSRLQPYFMRLSDIYSDPVKCQLGLDGFLKRFGEENEYVYSVGWYSIANNKIFVCSAYSDELFIVNNKSLEVEKTVKIKSKYSTIGKAKVEYIDENYKPRYNAIDITCGSMSTTQYDDNNNVYLVETSHDVDKEHVDDFQEYQTSSVIILDEEFNKIGECFFDNGCYDKFLTKKGLLVSDDDENDDRRKPKFTLYEVNI